MASFFFEQGLVIKRHGEFWEFTNRTETNLYFQQPETGERVTISEDVYWQEHSTDEIRVLNAFVSEKELVVNDDLDLDDLPELDAVSEEHQEKMLLRLSYIDALVERGITRGQRSLIAENIDQIAAELTDKNAPSAPTIQRWWKTYDASGKEASSMISRNAYRERTKRSDADSESFLQNVIETKYLVSTRPTMAGAYKAYKNQLKEANKLRLIEGKQALDQVCKRTFQRRIQEWPKKQVVEAREGKEAARHKFNMIKGHLPGTYPLDIVEIDHSPMNLFVLDDKLFLPLGRPWLTAVKCRPTGMLLGLYISFQKTGLMSIFGALKHSFTSHHKIQSMWDGNIENPWPSFGRGAKYVTDRGADFLSLRYRTAINSLGSRYGYNPKRTPWLKGSVERWFYTQEQSFYESMPGRTFSNLAIRGDYDPKKDAVIRFSVLIFLVHKWAADFYNVTPNSRHHATPLELWNEGVQIAPPPYPASIDELEITLGKHVTSTLSHEGLRFLGLNYADEGLRDLYSDIGKGHKLDYVVSYENLGRVQVLDPRSKRYFPVLCTRPDYAEGLSLLQHNLIRAEARASEDPLSEDMLIDTRSKLQDVFSSELDAKNNATKSNLARLAGINSNDVLDGNTRSIINPFNLSEKQQKQPEPVILVPFTSVPKYSWKLNG